MANNEGTEGPHGVSAAEWAELISTGLDAARSALESASGYVRANVAYGLAPGITRTAEDSYVLIRFGQLWARLHAAELLLTRARRLVRPPAQDDPTTNDALLQAQAFSRDIANEITNQSAVWTGSRGNDWSPRAGDFGTPWSYHRVGLHYLNNQDAEPVAQWDGSPRIRDSSVLRSPVRVIGSDAEAIAVAREVAAHLLPGASARDRERTLPAAELDELSRSGLMGISVPRSFGGAGVSTETLVTVFQLLSAADPAIGQLPQNHFAFVDAIRQDGTPAQQAFFFGQLLDGARLGNAQAERGGSSALNLRTRLLPTPNGEYLLNGTKYYCTGAITAHWIPVAALDDQERQVLAYVPREASGVELLKDWRGMGQRVTYSGTTHFRDVRVPTEHIIEHWRLFQRPNLYHPFAQLLHAAIDVGIAQNALEETASALRSRTRARLGAAVQKALEDPHVVRRVGELLTAFHAAEELVLGAARKIDAAEGAPDVDRVAEVAVAVSEAKAFAEDVVMAITNEMFALLGSSATDEELNLHRHWRNARTHTVHDANQWRYHHAGNYYLNGVAPGLPVRRLDGEGRERVGR
jgi:SfnB family sulfur acquisition oxidoreductase